MRSFGKSQFIAPLLTALLVHGSACTTDARKKNSTADSSDAASTDLPGGPDSTSKGPSSQPGAQPSNSQSDSSSSAPQNPDPGSSSAPSDDTQSEEPGEQPDPGACEDGEVDRNCHALEDGTPIEFPTGVPIGNCKAGTRVCEGNQWSPCKGAIAPLEKDNCEIPNDDATCDGVTNAGCDCVTGQTRDCGKSNIGACKLGTQRCVNGQWEEACEGAIYPEPEVCDGKGIDEDCNKFADLEDDECECIDDSSEYCERPKEKGDCKWGKRSCSNGKWGACKAWAKIEPEICGSRPDLDGVIWTGDENCDGEIDTSPIGKPGPKGCVKMMLDQDRDGFGKLGPDLANIRNKNQVELIGTACLCPNRPDIQEKVDQGWVERNSKANQDCGDCAPPYDRDGRNVFPRNRSTTTVSNRCLRHLGWSGLGGGSALLDFDLNCDGSHTDPDDRGDIKVIRCRKSGEFSCSVAGSGRLILPKGQARLTCGRRYEFGRCYAEVENGYHDDPGDTGTGGGDTTTEKPKKTFKGCRIEGTGRYHLIRCQ